MNELSLYVHIPFCARKCRYCDFVSFADKTECFEPYTKALISEIGRKSLWAKGYTIKSIFIGGGTPVILKRKQLADIFFAISKDYDIAEDCEITVEANPGILDRQMARQLKSMGVNRLSLGVQAWQKDLLELLGRIHTVYDVKSAVEMAHDADIENINADLIFAIPGQKMKDWEESLLKTIDLGVKHISAYSLIFEEGTPFMEALKNGELKPVSDKDDRRMYYLADEILSDAGFIKYEISNYGKPGFFSRHNINYWKCGDYLGFGLAAHSYFEGRRFSNTKNLADYVKKDGNPNLIEDYSEVLSKKVKMSEFMFMGLRMMEGIKIQEFQERFSEDFDEIYGNTAKDFVEKKLLERTKDGFRLTRRGIDVSNVVFEGFLL